MVNGAELLGLGGILLRLSIPDEKGGFKESRQFSYVVSQPVGLIVGQDALIYLGLLPMGFPNVPQVRPVNKGF